MRMIRLLLSREEGYFGCFVFTQPRALLTTELEYLLLVWLLKIQRKFMWIWLHFIGKYKIILDSDNKDFGGHERITQYTDYFTQDVPAHNCPQSLQVSSLFLSHTCTQFQSFVISLLNCIHCVLNCCWIELHCYIALYCVEENWTILYCIVLNWVTLYCIELCWIVALYCVALHWIVLFYWIVLTLSVVVHTI